MIQWIKEPEFKVINGGSYNRFVCIREGLVKIGKKHTLWFPLHWETDYCTSPRWSYSFVPQLGSYAPAVLIHDRMLSLNYSRKEAREAMFLQLDTIKNTSLATRTFIKIGILVHDLMLCFSKKTSVSIKI